MNQSNREVWQSGPRLVTLTPRLSGSLEIRSPADGPRAPQLRCPHSYSRGCQHPLRRDAGRLASRTKNRRHPAPPPRIFSSLFARTPYSERHAGPKALAAACNGGALGCVSVVYGSRWRVTTPAPNDLIEDPPSARKRATRLSTPSFFPERATKEEEEDALAAALVNQVASSSFF